MAKNDMSIMGMLEGIDKKRNNTKTERGNVPAYWRELVLRRQNNLCAGEDCEKIHNGKRMPVNSTNNFDHIKPLALGGKDHESNLQALCPTCHSIKTKKDRYDMAQRNKKNGKKENNGGMFGQPIFKEPKTSKQRNDNPFGFRF